ncbi:ATP-binding protein [Streptomyces sp. NPDC007162]|uniref:ATP-binding protein n=1 Tax=Streptomyces sp. NPDC007162 TaxID=3156917 RepID=UPI00340FC5D4
MQRQAADRESKGTVMRIRTAHFPQVKTLEDFNLDHLPSLRRDVLAHLATVTFVAKAENVILLGPPGIGKTRALDRKPAANEETGVRPCCRRHPGGRRPGTSTDRSGSRT